VQSRSNLVFLRILFPLVAVLTLVGAAAHAQTAGNTLVSVPPPGPPPVARQSWNPIAPYEDVQATLAASGQFTVLLSGLKATKLDKTFAAPKKKKKNAPPPEPVTLFAPTDAAFAKLPAGEVDALFADVARLKRLIGYHIVPAAVTSGDIRAAAAPVTAEGDRLTLEATPRRMAVNDAVVLQADVAATNGGIVVIDKVLVPPPAAVASAG
jgi:uncharacterized surface protein with fasciclin (FAS1) repeats